MRAGEPARTLTNDGIPEERFDSGRPYSLGWVRFDPSGMDCRQGTPGGGAELGRRSRRGSVTTYDRGVLGADLFISSQSAVRRSQRAAVKHSVAGHLPYANVVGFAGRFAELGRGPGLLASGAEYRGTSSARLRSTSGSRIRPFAYTHPALKSQDWWGPRSLGRQGFGNRTLVGRGVRTHLRFINGELGKKKVTKRRGFGIRRVSRFPAFSV